jgi:tetratricopeptide (TPR) repeat protein
MARSSELPSNTNLKLAPSDGARQQPTKAMKAALISIGAVAVIGAVALLMSNSKQPATKPQQASQASVDASASQSQTESKPAPPSPARMSQRSSTERPKGPAPSRPQASSAATESRTASTIHPRFESMLDPQTSFDDKQAILQQMAQSGKLDAAMSELEQRIRDNGPEPTVLATLGRVCLEKCGTLQDVREQGVLGLKADQLFEQALSNDSQNWDARYWKAFAMSFWPAQLGKTTEVIDSLLTLVEQQEAAAPRPEFARSYSLLGDLYKRSGHDAYARQVWQRGKEVFPNDSGLSEKLSSSQ